MLRDTRRVVLNTERCREIAEVLASKNVPPDQEEVEVPALPSGTIANFFLSLVAICHQTTPVQGVAVQGDVGGVWKQGWDFLFARFLQCTLQSPQIQTPESWSVLTSQDLAHIFSVESDGVQLTGLPLRAALLNDLGTRMLEKRWDSADDMYRLSQGRVGTGNPNLMDLLHQFVAFSDPVAKKTSLFLALMQNTGHWKYPDPHMIRPPVDYHEIRGHLRIGTIAIEDQSLRLAIATNHELSTEDDIEIRSAIASALIAISEGSGVRDVSRVHYLFWNIFRTVCVRELPHCFLIPQTTRLPARYVSFVTEGDSRRCPFASNCDSAGMKYPIVEYRANTHYY